MGDKHLAAIEMAYRSAEAHLSSLKREQAAAGQPCTTCRWAGSGSYSFQKVCHHPFLKRGTYDPLTGKTAWEHPRYADARRANCGALGVLHEPARPHQAAWRWLKVHWWLLPTAFCLTVLLLPVLILHFVK